MKKYSKISYFGALGACPWTTSNGNVHFYFHNFNHQRIVRGPFLWFTTWKPMKFWCTAAIEKKTENLSEMCTRLILLQSACCKQRK